MVASMRSQKPASASSTLLSTTSYTRWGSPAGPVPPIYIAGRFRTASSPSRTLICSALYVGASWAPCRSSAITTPPYTLDPLIASRPKKSAPALRQRPGRGGRTQGSYPHGHNDAAEALPFVWFEQGGGQRILDVHRDLRLLHHTQEVQEVPGVEPDGGLRPSILHST